ncbi:aspartate/glutamate racemase family protein [Planococcus chinensis]|uniref:Aspartate/glutamate racemase family protein n=1 Tax=Planococcus chinensis TaxID=272917 RepID=A0ABW4QCP4_9BACL
MPKLGMVGGTGPESTVEYYQAIIKRYQDKTGNPEELPEFLIHSINMYKIFDLVDSGEEGELVAYLAAAVQDLQKAGADFAVLAANTPHIVFEEVRQETGVPMISIVEETFREADRLNLGNVGLIGTKFTMENDFFKEPFLANGKKLVVPNGDEQDYIHEKIVDELEKGIVKPETKDEFLNIISRMVEEDGIDGIILGCTELPMLIKPEDTKIRQLDTLEIHAAAIAEAMVGE